ncbi:MAG: hypothetical protein GY861_18465 [bacterium]|nr:hypothetical protein [bacterium]
MAERKQPSDVEFKGLEDKDGLVAQINSEFKYSSDFMVKWWERKLIQLNIYYNQDKEAMTVSDNMMYSTQDTMMAALYDDQPRVRWVKRDNQDEELAENLTFLTEYDYDLMDMDSIRYSWIWNALFFGRSLVMMLEWDSKNKCPVPEIMNPMTTFRDPKATSVNGDSKGRGATRFLGFEVIMTNKDIEQNKAYKEIDPDALKNEKIPINSGEDFSQQRDRRSQAEGHTNFYQDDQEDFKGDNRSFPILRWFTSWKGKKVMVELANGVSEIIRYKVLSTEYWPFIDRSMSPQPDSWDGVSVAGLTEDKQRANARMINATLHSVETAINPRYIYDKRVIRNKRALQEWKFNKYVPADGPVGAALTPIPKDVPPIGVVDWTVQSLRSIGQTAAATPNIQQGQVSSENKTATEIASVQQNVDQRFSKISKVFGWSERDFWEEWYRMYKRHMGSFEEKVVAIRGVQGEAMRTLKKDDIISKNLDPIVKVESSVLSEAKRLNQLQADTNLFSVLSGVPDTNIRFLAKEIAKDSKKDASEIDRLFPPTPDEKVAREENELVLKGKVAPPAEVGQDHAMHRMLHAKLDESKKKDQHMKTHDAAEMLEVQNPDLKGEPQLGMQDQRRLMMEQTQPGVKTENKLQDQTFQAA